MHEVFDGTTSEGGGDHLTYRFLYPAPNSYEYKVNQT